LLFARKKKKKEGPDDDVFLLRPEGEINPGHRMRAKEGKKGYVFLREDLDRKGGKDGRGYLLTTHHFWRRKRARGKRRVFAHEERRMDGKLSLEKREKGGRPRKALFVSRTKKKHLSGGGGKKGEEKKVEEEKKKKRF